ALSAGAGAFAFASDFSAFSFFFFFDFFFDLVVVLLVWLCVLCACRALGLIVMHKNAASVTKSASRRRFILMEALLKIALEISPWPIPPDSKPAPARAQYSPPPRTAVK